MTETANWPGFKYKPVGAITNRLISRYLRGERKRMLRFFRERGLFDFIVRVERIRNSSRLNMLQKNAAFQKVLDDYAKQVVPNDQRETSDTARETTPVVSVGAVAVRDEGGSSVSSGIGTDNGNSVRSLASETDGE